MMMMMIKLMNLRRLKRPKTDHWKWWWWWWWWWQCSSLTLLLSYNGRTTAVCSFHSEVEGGGDGGNSRQPALQPP